MFFNFSTAEILNMQKTFWLKNFILYALLRISNFQIDYFLFMYIYTHYIWYNNM
jgi:hypothetical protein